MSPMRNIRVVAYEPAWRTAFEQEAAVLVRILGDGLVTIHHIGSTAVPGLPAKPVIDMMPLVREYRKRGSAQPDDGRSRL